MTIRISRQVLGYCFAVLMIALSSCAPRFEADPNATPIAVMNATSVGFDLTMQVIDSTRAATISAYETQNAGSAALTVVPVPFAEAVFVLVNADCHFGPGTNYGIVISLYPGESALLLGVDSGGSWFYIETVSTIRCWILASLVSPPVVIGTAGVTATLPVVPPPPTPFSTLTPSPVPTFQDIGTPVP
jgi:uncharacterized protein YraI